MHTHGPRHIAHEKFRVKFLHIRHPRFMVCALSDDASCLVFLFVFQGEGERSSSGPPHAGGGGEADRVGAVDPPPHH